jgi:hypothetical protein
MAAKKKKTGRAKTKSARQPARATGAPRESPVARADAAVQREP